MFLAPGIIYLPLKYGWQFKEHLKEKTQEVDRQLNREAIANRGQKRDFKQRGKNQADLYWDRENLVKNKFEDEAFEEYMQNLNALRAKRRLRKPKS